MRQPIVILITFFYVSLVLAQAPTGTPTIGGSMEALITGLRELFVAVNIPFGPIFDYLISITQPLLKILFGILLFLIVYSIIDTTNLLGGKKIFTLLVSIGVTMLAMSVLPAALLEKLIPLYGSMFTTLPSAIFFVLLLGWTFKVESLWIVRTIWIMIAAFFTILFLSLGIPSFNGGLYGQSLIYFILMIVSVIISIFIKPIRKAFFDAQMDDVESRMKADVSIDRSVQEAHKTEANAYKKTSNH